jgi:hypothetical protein
LRRGVVGVAVGSASDSSSESATDWDKSGSSGGTELRK